MQRKTNHQEEEDKKLNIQVGWGEDRASHESRWESFFGRSLDCRLEAKSNEEQRLPSGKSSRGEEVKAEQNEVRK